jgi:hypothetical protein
MGVGAGGPELPPLDLDRLTDDLASPSRRTRKVLYVVVGVVAVVVLVAWIVLLT